MIKNKIVITSLPKWSYFQWFLLGFYKLQRQGDLDIVFKLPLVDRLSLYIDNYYLFGVGQRYYSGKDSFCLEGYLESGGIKKRFCIDHQDSPYLFDSKQLQDVDLYFKMQCPKEFDKKGFRLNDDVWIPWTDHAHVDSELAVSMRGPRKPCSNLFENINKIRPLMVGPRHLGYGNGYRALNKGLINCMLSQSNPAEKTLMCYFGNSLGPKPSQDICDDSPIDFNWESDLMARFTQLGHPNEKRSRATKILQQLGANYDGRLIRDGYADGSADIVHKEQIVPLEDFCEHISHFKYNLNISGYRLSIPNRFIESFMVGTAIVTDKLAVKWYKPFDREVFETVEMGYLSDDKVDWGRFQFDIDHLPKVDKKDVCKAFDEKWEPSKVASYMIDELLNS